MYHSKVIVTQRAKELFVALGFMCCALYVMHYPLDPKTGWWLGEGVFMLVFALTYLREERRAFHPPDAKIVVLWNRLEEWAFTLVVVAFYLCGFILHHNWSYLYAYLNTYVIGLLSGLLAGEILWQNMRLRQVEGKLRDRYWAAYNDSIFVIK
jgi:hypothetical protein